jgi:nucleoside-diphosphate-sugar epimerase
MKIVITGGGGFLGSRLAALLLARGSLLGRPIEQLVLLDAAFRAPPTDPRVIHAVGDIAHRDFVFANVGTRPDTVIFHLASMVSGECEQSFDNALRVNLDGGRNVFEAARAIPGRPRVVFASSIACYGGLDMTQPMSDLTKQRPQTTYGATKAICELLVNDHTRKGHFDGRSLRLPTVVIRPGRPNAAASGWASGMFREPLAGQPCLLPVRRDQPHPMTGYRTVAESFAAMAEIPEERLGSDRAVVLPAHRVTPRLAEAALAETAAARGLRLGPIVDAFDPKIQAMVDTWAQEIDASRAIALGLPKPPPLSEIIAQFLEDFGR